MPYVVETPVDQVAVDPYGVDSPDFVVGDNFAHMRCSALAHGQERFEGKTGKYRKEPAASNWIAFPSSMFSAKIAASSPIRVTALR